MSEEIVLEHRGWGYAAKAPGFHVWDEDPREVMRTALLLRGVARCSPGVQPADQPPAGSIEPC